MSTGQTLYHNAKIYGANGPVDHGWMLVDGSGLIAEMGSGMTPASNASGGGAIPPLSTARKIVDCQGKMLLPGFIDVHVHGGGGFDVLGGSREDLEGMSLFHAAHGTTSFLATTTTADHDTILRVLDTASSAIGRLSGADLAGIHLEGPFIHPKRRGAQALASIQTPSVEQVQTYLQAANGNIRIVTMAPEVEGGMESLAFLVSKGVTVSAGHTDATLEQMRLAVSAGVNHTTHHFNGMSPLHHREPGAAGAGLMMPEITTELICDGIHVHPAVVELLFRVKGPGSVCLITDAVICAGLPDGAYGDVVMKQGEIWLADGSSLAGSGLTMLNALRNAMKFTGLPLETILPSLTVVPARQAGLSDRKGSLQKGKEADFVVLDPDLQLWATYVKGKAVYQRA